MIDDQQFLARNIKVEARDASTEKNADQEIDLVVGIDSVNTFIVPTKGSDKEQRSNVGGSRRSTRSSASDTEKTVTTTTVSGSLTIDGISESVINYREEIQNKRDTTPHNVLDWSFLRNGELFDREEQKTLLLNAFYRELNVDDNSNTNKDSSQNNPWECW